MFIYKFTFAQNEKPYFIDVYYVSSQTHTFIKMICFVFFLSYPEAIDLSLLQWRNKQRII